MPGPILDLASIVTCGHGGPAFPTATVPRVFVSTKAVATIASPYAVSGCPFTGGGGPCVTGQWVVGATRVFAMGQPVAIQGGVGVCVPTGAPLLAILAQPRAIAM